MFSSAPGHAAVDAVCQMGKDLELMSGELVKTEKLVVLAGPPWPWPPKCLSTSSSVFERWRRWRPLAP